MGGWYAVQDKLQVFGYTQIDTPEIDGFVFNDGTSLANPDK
jgi:hypothetical protein